VTSRSNWFLEGPCHSGIFSTSFMSTPAASDKAVERKSDIQPVWAVDFRDIANCVRSV
jgi:hypothetical protein